MTVTLVYSTRQIVELADLCALGTLKWDKILYMCSRFCFDYCAHPLHPKTMCSKCMHVGIDDQIHVYRTIGYKVNYVV